MQNRVLVYVEAVDVAAEGAVWYASLVAGGAYSALHVPGKNTDTGIRARWFDLTGGDSLLEIRPQGTDPIAAVLEAVERLRAHTEETIVTVVLPERFERRSLLEAAQRAQFRLKLRLLVEPRTVVADVPAVTSRLRPEGQTPQRLLVRVLASSPDAATRRALDYARLLGAGDLRAVHLGERDWGDAELGVAVDDAPRKGRLGESLLAYLRDLTAADGTVVNVVLPERLHANLRRLRSREALAVKRCLLFEPSVILSSVPHGH